mmetsp:Transcript_37414/g.87255  ORF Transcript_37414/g.87255 Transcript_37414/m.87255 type:complete len:217 (-) Transcript_37414:335-985(-)|eukprot:CAMPEP_0113311294 /NCGR_PEP_ID=MMETSP0010_2-20120614/8589_1 /TAXON_ID=216773 ORGANISM="Corethron hystrix, Strain 308" /NCGR_SAMPLE_ID=MMETSP0010_2 /ASSEMBLY_ACC=CAM_ASM_000155 /LENGTH=216 /DNA_ID=CAMNT_0000166905 /DNA_START=215 /DNA_END=865 /DNA_ORIENTATION=+ /assembly_acc=CAM_ASM_000155
MGHISGIIATLAVLTSCSSAFHGQVPTFRTIRSDMTMRKGRPSLKKTVRAGISDRTVPMGGDEIVKRSTPIKWVSVEGAPSLDDLPKDENKVKLINTMADALIDGAVNPYGSVAVTTFQGKTYCFAASCSCCKIPMDKAKVYVPNEESGKDPRVCCDFCGSTFNARSGKRLENAPERSSGLLGGFVKGLFSASPTIGLNTYDLGEQNGKVVIAVPK